MCLKDWHASYHELLEQCHLAALRDYLSLSHLCKIIQGSCFFPNAPINRYSNNYLTRSHERSHFIQLHAYTNVLHYSYFPYSISLWNSLPQSIALPFHHLRTLVLWYNLTSNCKRWKRKVETKNRNRTRKLAILCFARRDWEFEGGV